jgi:hypothetical protein
MMRRIPALKEADVVTKERLHELVDSLPDDALIDAEKYLSRLNDPVAWALEHAPEDDEPETPEERIAATQAWDDFRRGDVLSDEELTRFLSDPS